MSKREKQTRLIDVENRWQLDRVARHRRERDRERETERQRERERERVVQMQKIGAGMRFMEKAGPV